MNAFRCLSALILTSWMSSAVYGQTLADVARQERARKKALESKIVINETSAPAGKTVTTAAATDKPIVTAATPTAPKGPVDNKGRDETYWRTTFQNARQGLKRAEDRAKLLDVKLTDLNSQLLREGIANRERELRESIDTTKKEQAAANIELQAAQQKIRDLEEELRLSGGPPGWAR